MMPRRVETACLYVLIVVAALRPLVAESYSSAVSATTVALGEIADPGPVRTLVFDLAVLVCAAVTFVCRRRSYRWTGIEFGAFLVVLAALVSCAFAGNRRLAINGSIDWVCGAVLAVALVQLMTRAGHRRILVAAVLASACVQAVVCIEQYLVGFEETWAQYEGMKEEFWGRQGVALDSEKVALFEGRMKAREASGTFPHSSIAGSYLSLAGLTALGVMVGRWRRAASSARMVAIVAAAGLSGLVLWALALTKSLGAIVATVLASVGWLSACLAGDWVRRHRKAAVAVGWCGALAVMAAGVGHGLRHEGLPGVSLTFRWQYWTASSGLIADHWLTGVGRQNFGRHYLQYKTIESPEEVSNPHNMFVQAAAEWGVLGLAGLCAMVIGGSLFVAGAWGRMAAAHSANMHGSGREAASAVWMLGVGTAVVLGRLVLSGSSDPMFLYYTGMVTGLVWLIGFAVVGLPALGGAGIGAASERAIASGIGWGLFAVLVHELINFALFVPGAMTTVFALFAVAVSCRYGDEDDSSRAAAPQHVRGRWIPGGLMCAAVLCVLFLGVIPVGRSGALLQEAKAAARVEARGRPADHPADDLFRRAGRADPFDPTPWVERARWALSLAVSGYGREGFEIAAESLGRAVERDPYDVKLPRMQTRLFQLWAEQGGGREALERAIAAARKALELYPQDPSGLVRLGDCLGRAGLSLGSEAYVREAMARYEEALRLDAERLAWETLRRFSAARRGEIESKIERLAQELGQLGTSP